MSIRVAVVGAGVVGLAAASALRQAGVEVRCFEKAVPGQGESAGQTRIFRTAHGDPVLVRLAMQARAGWDRWERRYGRQLVGAEGMIVSGAPLVERWGWAMSEGGASHRPLTTNEVLDLLPYCRPPDGQALLDPTAGAIRASRTIDCLHTELAPALIHAEVLELTATPAGMRVLTTIDTWECDEVLLTAGSATVALGAQVGVQLPTNLVRHARFTYAPRNPQPPHAPACWIDESGAYGADLSSYGQPVGTTGQYAVGVHSAGTDFPASTSTEEVGRRSREIAQRYVKAALPGLHPEPTAELQCVYNSLGFPDGDGFAATRAEAITVFYGNNLFKFAPLLGDLLCQAILRHEVPADLMPLGIVSPR
ncbi:MAG TPA: FAD-dependent oxidoreductase [Chloroflexota bacterium]|nr:FAD-dependent oxidoreductase [Chloroflexota bacterium]